MLSVQDIIHKFKNLESHTTITQKYNAKSKTVQTNQSNNCHKTHLFKQNVKIKQKTKKHSHSSSNSQISP